MCLVSAPCFSQEIQALIRRPSPLSLRATSCSPPARGTILITGPIHHAGAPRRTDPHPHGRPVSYVSSNTDRQDDLGVRFPLYAPQVLLHPQVLALQEGLLWSLAVAVSPRVGPFLIVPPEPVVHVCLQLLQRPVQVLPEQEGSNTWDPQ